MNMKNTAILLIFLLSVLGLIIGVYYTEDINVDKAAGESSDIVKEDSNGGITITSEKTGTNLEKFFT